MKTECSFDFGLWDVNAEAEGKLTSNSSQAFADVQTANGGSEPRKLPNVATPDWVQGWVLDGKYEPIPDNAEDYPWGWWSREQCEDDCNFAVPPVLVAEFFDTEGNVTLHSSVGITLDFAGVLPREVDISWYDAAGEKLAEGAFYPDEEKYFCDMPVENYAKVEISVPAMSWPRCFLRVQNVLFGLFATLGDGEVINAELTEEVSISCDTLPIDELEVSFYTPNGKFALLNPAGQYQYFQYRQKLTAWQVVDGAKRCRGEYYLQTAEATVDAVTKLKCVDIIGILDGEEYKGGYFEAVPLAEILAEILNPLGVGFEICPELAEVSISGWLAAGSVRNALQRLIFAAGGYILTAGGSEIRIVSAPDEVLSIGAERKVMGHKVTLDELITGVKLTAYTYKKGDYGELWRGDLKAGEQDIYFTEPGEVKSVTGAELIEVFERLNGCRVNVLTDGEVTVNGYAFEVTKQEISEKVPGLPVGTREKIKSFDGVTVLTEDLAQAKAIALRDYYRRRYVDEGDLLPGAEYAGAMVQLASLGGRSIIGQVEKLTTDLTGGGIESVKIVGMPE